MVHPKKYLGQHFLTDRQIAEKITDFLSDNQGNILEIGPGKGILTQYLVNRESIELKVIEIDTESVNYLKHHFPELTGRIIEKDFLTTNLTHLFNGPFSVIGNFPYNISSQILFKVLENRGIIPELVGMFQKEVAERISSGPGSKKYGILSVLVQAYYHIHYLFTVNEGSFFPPPRVKSGVVKLVRKQHYQLKCDESLFFRVVKTAFNQRRKTLKNSLKSLITSHAGEEVLFSKRPEQLAVKDFIFLTNYIKLKSPDNDRDSS